MRKQGRVVPFSIRWRPKPPTPPATRAMPVPVYVQTVAVGRLAA